MLGDDTLSKLKRWNYGVQRIRCRIEKIFGTWKRSYGLQQGDGAGLQKPRCMKFDLPLGLTTSDAFSPCFQRTGRRLLAEQC